MKTTISPGDKEDGSADAGDIIFFMFARDGGTPYESASYLGVSLVRTNGTPVPDTLAHLPPLPYVINYRLDKDDDPILEYLYCWTSGKGQPSDPDIS